MILRPFSIRLARPAVRGALAGLLSLALPARPLAHEGHDHGPKMGDAAAVGPVTLTPQARLNLGIEVTTAEIGPLQPAVTLLARVQAIPEKTARLSARIAGHVTEIFVRLGQAVKQGEPLLKVEPLTIDTPPVVLPAPIDGIVTAQHAAIGTAFTAETVLVELADLRTVLVKGVAYENADLADVKEGAPASVKLDFYRDRNFAGHVERIAPTLDLETRTFELYALLDNADLRLKPGLQGTMAVAVGEAAAGVSVPARAVLGSMGNLFVFVETTENTFERRPTVVGQNLGDRWEILEGVLPGDRVVVRGHYQLQFVPGPAPAAAATTTASAPKAAAAGGREQKH